MAGKTKAKLSKRKIAAPSDVDNEIDANLLHQIHQGDCVEGMRRLPDGCIDLAFADPPFNIGFTYDVYDDRLESEKYLEWSRQWIGEVHRVLKATGSFWLAIGDEYAAELKVAAVGLGFTCRSWVIWYYTFGVHCKYKFTRSHAHLFHFVKDESRFKFNNDAVRVPSARQLVYADARAHSTGRMPDDTWVLRPQDMIDGFTPGEDVWYFPRVAGTFKERAGFHGCQMPEQLLGRIVRCCSDKGDVVMDPFSGSSTTVAVAKKLQRDWLSFELSDEYVKLGTNRLAAITPGDPLDGSAEPRVSAPTTANGKSKLVAKAKPQIFLPKQDPAFGFKARTSSLGTPQPGLFDFETEPDDDTALIEVFGDFCDGFSLDRVIADPVLNADLQLRCDRREIAGTPAERNRRLFRLRADGKLKLAGIETTHRTLFSWAEQAKYRFASEIAWRKLSDEYPGRTLDELLCEPRTAEQFDVWATRFCPGPRPLEYRWAALTLRRRLRSVSGRDDATPSDAKAWEKRGEGVSIGDAVADAISRPAVYAIGYADRPLYVGESTDLAVTLSDLFRTADQRRLWADADDTAAEPRVWSFPIDPADPPLVHQLAWVKRHVPRWNVSELVAEEDMAGEDIAGGDDGEDVSDDDTV